VNPASQQGLFAWTHSTEWATSPVLFRQLDEEFGFTLDPCATEQTAKCARFFTREDNGLAQDWSKERVFMNPPFGRQIKWWMKKAWEESQRGALVVCLVPARTDTAWWHDWAVRGEVRFLRGRGHYVTPDGKRRGTEAFPSAIVVFSPNGTPNR
jgi:phage N-6-adenine-methyltransferase